MTKSCIEPDSANVLLSAEQVGRAYQHMLAPSACRAKPASQREAIAAVMHELSAMSQEEFRAMLDAHPLGELGQSLLALQDFAQSEGTTLGGFYGLDDADGLSAAVQVPRRGGDAL